MRLNFSIWFSVLAFFVTLTSCKDYQIPATQRFRIKKIRTTYADANATGTANTYNYDGNGRLANYVGYYGNSSLPSDSTIISYDTQGRIQGILHESWYAYRSVWRPIVSYTYEYDMSGNISVIKEYFINVLPTSPSLVKEFQLAYGDTKFPVKVTSDFWDSSGFKLGQSVEQYTYNGGNIVKVEKSENQSANVTTTFQYDDKPNPYYGLITGEPDIRMFSMNNAVTSDKQYMYDSNGLLTKVVTTTATTEYEYEAY
ncbi:hypothetical protein GO755_21675 [Spirosoma sp. HMF4905]|uniref:YD repeat-containing protein n=1 Tax=Spirosoma arboris TaxID=2682092 RepID=A0A7K1SGG6_9BACT|nr:hypothetical protein [Spirosoma arboris]MVM32666.1 hypothetical protein [Spirosoma arboris]